MPTFSFSSLPLSDSSLEPHQIAALLREWQHCNYEFVFAPHRYCTDLQKVVHDIYMASHFFPFEDEANDPELVKIMQRDYDFPKDPTPLIQQAFKNSRGVLAYNRSAIKAVGSFGITIENEMQLCKKYVQGRIISNQRAHNFSYFSNISDEFFEVPDPLVVPTMLVHPWYSLLLPWATNNEHKSIQQFIEPHPSVPNALLCTITTYNIPCLLDKGGKNHRQRETWQLLQERFAHCSILQLPYAVEIEGDVAMTRDELPQLRLNTASAPQVTIKLTLPLVTPAHVQTMNLTLMDFDADGNENLELSAYYGLDL